ncbi:hypothetical protein RMSM_06318, partial [Rhodopirellula maiorica SM1]
MLEAVAYAEQTSGDYWEFAVELDRLISYGLTLNDFRWLVRSHYVEHQCEITLERDDGRAFRPTGDLTFPERTCFVLTKLGVEFARQYCMIATNGNGHANDATPRNAPPYGATPCCAEKRETGPQPMSSVVDDAMPKTILIPTWDPQRRQLRFNGVAVKEFRWTAHNQEAVLSAFQEEDWPARIDDPLPPHAEQDSKRRLSDTIKCLNRKQVNPILHFRGDGTGEG